MREREYRIESLSMLALPDSDVARILRRDMLEARISRWRRTRRVALVALSLLALAGAILTP